MELLTKVYRCPDGTEFPVVWDDPEQERLGWRWDQMHCPLPITPLSTRLGNDLLDGFNQASYVLGGPARVERFVANGYLFNASLPFDDDPAIRAGVREREAALRTDRVLEHWEEQYRPEVEALTRSLRAYDEPGLSFRQLVDRFDRVHAVRRRQGELHHLTMGPVSAAANRFIDFCLAEFGPGGEQLAAELTQGFPNKSLESAAVLWELSREAQARPEVAELLRSAPAGEVPARLATVGGGREFLVLLEGYLDEYGHRSEAFIELSYPTWRENASFPLFLLRHYLDTPEESSPGALHDASVKRREERTAETEQRLAGDPEKLATFRAWQRSAQQRTVILEDHNFYIDQQGLCAGRVPCLAIGRELAKQGSVDLPDDVFYLVEPEIREAAAHPETRLAGVVAARREERERWTRTLPPAVIGDGNAELPPAMARFFGPTAEEPQEPGVVRGIAASAGIVRGAARLVLTLEDVGRLAPGEILVTYATAPPWTPLFAVAGGVVTDSGGTLSHCAVVAREYGIPAVVGCKTATARIPDGALITVDGSAGTVRIEE